MTVIRWEREDTGPVVERIVHEFEEGRPVILPTETLYGIAAPISSGRAMRTIFKLKKRPEEMTLPVAVGALHQLDALVRIHRWQKTSLRSNLPGPVTFIMESKQKLPPEVEREGTVAVRVPRHPVFLELTKKCGPLGLTSANLHGDDEIMKAGDINDLFRGELLVVEDDATLGGEASAILDITEKTPRILRKGNVFIEGPMRDEHGR
ncbi:MAG: L-threonylcarbamoyladenylate synthase [Thermoplasmatota archaeon]